MQSNTIKPETEEKWTPETMDGVTLLSRADKSTHYLKAEVELPFKPAQITDLFKSAEHRRHIFENTIEEEVIPLNAQTDYWYICLANAHGSYLSVDVIFERKFEEGSQENKYFAKWTMSAIPKLPMERGGSVSTASSPDKLRIQRLAMTLYVKPANEKSDYSLVSVIAMTDTTKFVTVNEKNTHFNVLLKMFVGLKRQLPNCFILSRRGLKYHETPDFLTATMKCFENPYDPETNPTGYINLGVAENVLTSKLMKSKFAEIRKENPIDEKDFVYGDFTGSKDFRIQCAKLFHSKICQLPENVELSYHAICATNGAGTLIEQLTATLCNKGDHVLIPSPQYHGLENDLNKRFQCEQTPVPLKEVKKPGELQYSYELDFSMLENKYAELKEQGKEVKAFLHVNPHNPTGIIFTEQETKKLIEWCLKHKIHFISDELYALSVFTKPSRKFVSALYICKMYANELKGWEDYVHIVYSFSKDFGLNGFRLGVLYSENYDLLLSMKICAYFTGCSTDTISLVTKMLEDENFVNTYIASNKTNLEQAWNESVALMEKENVPYCVSEAGMFLYVNLLRREKKQTTTSALASKTKKTFTVEDEKKLWHKMLDENGGIRVYLTPGFVFKSPEPGWFRCCISATSSQVLMLAWKRIFDGLDK